MSRIDSVSLFRDDTGVVAQLHGVGLQRFDGVWWAYGENKKRGDGFQGVACYSSLDFVHWRNEGLALAVEDGAIGPGRIGERPKVLRCPKTGMYVMYIHLDKPKDPVTGLYPYKHIGVAVAENPEGPFEFRTAMQWHGYDSSDIGVFQDEDGTGYVLSEDRARGTHIYRLSRDYLTLIEDVACVKDPLYESGYESPTIVKRDGLYYWFGSELTGWSPNDNHYATAENLAGPWSEWRTFAPVGTNTFQSQCDLVVPLDDDPWHSNRFMYVGDRWHEQDLGNSELVLLPIEIGDGVARMNWVDQWEL